MSNTRPGGHQTDLFELPPSAEPAPAVPGVEPPAAPAFAPPAAAAPQAAKLDEPAAAPVAADGKDPEAFRTIGEVAQALAIRQHVLRYWEEQFPMLRPVKRSGGRRYYRPEDIRLVETINRLVHAEGYTLRGARQLLEAEVRSARQLARGKMAAPKPATPKSLGAPASADVLSQLRAIRATLAAALQAS